MVSNRKFSQLIAYIILYNQLWPWLQPRYSQLKVEGLSYGLVFGNTYSLKLRCSVEVPTVSL
jgi:hypothetical protein